MRELNKQLYVVTQARNRALCTQVIWDSDGDIRSSDTSDDRKCMAAMFRLSTFPITTMTDGIVKIICVVDKQTHNGPQHLRYEDMKP